MKIKTIKKMRLDELLKNVWDGNLPAKTYASDRFTEIVNVNQNGVDFSELKFGEIHKNTTYTVEVEEELTEDTELDGLVAITNHDKIRLIDNIHTIESALNFEKTYEKYEKIYGKSDGELKLVWSRESGIPEEGMIEL